MHQIQVERDEQQGYHAIVVINDEVAWITDSYTTEQAAQSEAQRWIDKNERDSA